MIGRRWRYSEARGTLSAGQAAARPTFWPSWWAGDKVVSPAGLPVEAADLIAATDNLAKLLGKEAPLQQALVRPTGKLTEAGPAGTSAIE